VDWSGGDTPDSTISLSGNDQTVTVSFKHAYDTTDSVVQAPNFWATDEDTVPSSYRDTTFSVRLGAPVLSGDSGDTLWVVVDAGTGTYDLHVNAFDTNGTGNMPVRYYWQDPDVEPDFDSTIANTAVLQKTDNPSVSWAIGQSKINHGFPLLIYALDDDTLLRGSQFTIYADSAPPEPLGLNKEQDGDSVEIQWDSLALDEKDGFSTEIQIMIRFDSSGDPDEVLMDWTEAGLLPTMGTKRYFRFEKEYTGDILYQVILRDNRGTESKSTIAPATIN
jgi:hypothetical protein